MRPSFVWVGLAVAAMVASGCTVPPSAVPSASPSSSGGHAGAPQWVTISGFTETREGYRVPEVLVTLETGDGKAYQKHSSRSGGFDFTIEPAPECTLRPEKQGYSGFMIRGSCDRDVEVALRLQAHAGSGGSPPPDPPPADPPPPPPPGPPDEAPGPPPPPKGLIPHVIVAIPDTGINPYHEIFYRPHLTKHPCTYIQDFPCDVAALPLSVGEEDWQTAFDKDKEIWADVQQGKWYWIPRTVFVAVSCEYPYDPAGGDICILDDSHPHGTGTVSAVLMENPDALIAFKEGHSNLAPFIQGRIPVDIFSVSWGNLVPVPSPVPGLCLNGQQAPIYVVSAGNDMRTSLADCWKGNPNVISVGGAYSNNQREEPMAAKQPEVVSYFCRPTADTRTVTGMRQSYCGTSFAAPTVAGGLSAVILELRRTSGYTGSVVAGGVDPILDVSVADLRDALNRTASYAPEPKYPNTSAIGVPLNPVAPCVQWGWGFYDGWVARDTVAYLLDGAPAASKPAVCEDYMRHVHTVKRTLYG